MKQCLRRRILAVCLSTAACLPSAPAATAQSVPSASVDSNRGPASPGPDDGERDQPAAERRPSLVQPFVDALGDVRRLPSWRNITWLGAGLSAAAVSHPADGTVSRAFSSVRTDSFRPGAIIGATPAMLGGAFATYAAGRALHRPRAMSLGADLVRAQVLAELLTVGVKQSVRRSRPEGEGFSFPSGHTAVSFSTATVLHHHFGWKVGAVAYGVASYVAASRVQMRRHYLSDVAFGATVGIVAGRTVTVGRHPLVLSPFATPGGGGVLLTWAGRP